MGEGTGTASTEAQALFDQITADVPASCRTLWAHVRAEATRTASATRPETRGGAAGFLWDGALVHAMEHLWPPLGDRRYSAETNAVRRTLHQYLTRQGLVHCDYRGGGPHNQDRVPRWWVSAEFDPQPGGWRQRFPAGSAPDPAAQPDQHASEEAEDADTRSFAEVVAQVWEIVHAAVRTGAPLTSTALLQIPTGVTGAVRRAALEELESSGVVWSESWGFGGRPVKVYLCDVSREVPAADGADRRSPAEALEELLADYRRKDETISELTAKVDGAQARLDAIDRALGR